MLSPLTSQRNSTEGKEPASLIVDATEYDRIDKLADIVAKKIWVKTETKGNYRFISRNAGLKILCDAYGEKLGASLFGKILIQPNQGEDSDGLPIKQEKEKQFINWFSAELVQAYFH